MYHSIHVNMYTFYTCISVCNYYHNNDREHILPKHHLNETIQHGTFLDRLLPKMLCKVSNVHGGHQSNLRNRMISPHNFGALGNR